jgi:hypothetical protein
MCGLFAVDIAGSTAPGRDDEIQWYVHKSMYDILETAFDGSGLPWKRCIHEDRGDGAVIIIPPGLAPAALIDPLPERLRSLIRRHNRIVREPARIQLRAAAHIGQVHYDGNGFVGTDFNVLFRMLDARPLKRALADSGAELALITSRLVYENVIVRHPSLADPAAFRPVKFLAKGTRFHAWMHVPMPPQPEN